MRQHLVMLILLAHLVGALLGPADARADSGCKEHACSNDASSANAVFGDELLEWDSLDIWNWKDCSGDGSEPCASPETERCYEVASYPQLRTLFRLCERTVFEPWGSWYYQPPPNAVSPYKAGPDDFPRYGESHQYVVRACVGATCGVWAPQDTAGSQLSVEFVGGAYACFGQEQGQRCEKRCYPGAPKAFADIPDCTDPN
jgi:hypothetical protein